MYLSLKALFDAVEFGRWEGLSWNETILFQQYLRQDYNFGEKFIWALRKNIENEKKIAKLSFSKYCLRVMLFPEK